MSDSDPVSTLRSAAERNGWHLDVWPGNRIEPRSEIRLRVGAVTLKTRSREIEECASVMNAALGEIAGALNAS